jgi:hypothetical protein
MTDYNAITPPPELVQKWIDANRTWLRGIALEAAQWGADAELEKCCEALDNLNDGYWSGKLRAARRPKPPSLKEQALALLDKAEDPSWDINDFSIVRKALEQLPE